VTGHAVSERGVVTLIGLDGSPLGPAASGALAAATLVVGGRRNLAAAPAPPGAAVVELGPLAPALAALAGHRGNAVVLASGDPGFFGILRCLRQQGLECEVHPAVSSVALAFARAGVSWDDARVASAHGRDPRRAVNLCRAHPKVAVLTGPDYGPAELGAALAGWSRRLVVAERLGTPDERVTACPAQDAAGRQWRDPNVVLVLADQPAADGPGWTWPPGPASAGPASADVGATGWALPEDHFFQEAAVITKAEVRAIALARLGPAPGRLVWDVGAGTGSVGVECARLGSAVIAIERNPRRAQLVRNNARRYGADIRVIEGAAPAALHGLPDPDAVFIGGGGGGADGGGDGGGVVEAVATLQPPRIVITLAAVERVGPAHAALTAAGYAVDGTLVQASRLSALPGDVHRLDAVNPVFVLWGDLASAEGALPGDPADSEDALRGDPADPEGGHS
jgi:precorrin-6Y C5,15-methyltransferase (decarboxylating)